MAESELDRHERERLKRDFLPEAEEILDALAGDLRGLDRSLATERVSPADINTIFRRVHSLKGLAGMAGLQAITDLAHDLEELLDRLRMGRTALAPPVLELLEDALETLFRMVREVAETGATSLEASAVRGRLRASGGPGSCGPDAPSLDALDPAIRAALSEFEEHRLREALEQGRAVFVIRLRLPGEGFEPALKEALGRLHGEAEVISTVPSAEPGSEGTLNFAILVVSGAAGAASLAERLRGLPAAVEPLEIPAPRGAAGAAEGPVTLEAEDLKGFSTSLRVPVARLDDLLAQVADLSIAAASLARATARAREAHPEERSVREAEQGVRELAARLRTLQRSAVDARLMPLEQVFGRLGRLVARTARASGKEVDLHTLGGENELDKAMMDRLVSPLVHLVANALDHGVEPPEERLAAGKSRRGRLVLSAFRRGNRVVIDVSDDGRGIVVEAVQGRARSSGLLAEDRVLSRQEAYEMIFAAGFSTAGRVSQVSGRGVGLDVVRRSIRALKGTIEARSVERQGTTFTVTVPITLALVQALIVRSRGRRFAIPVASIRENLRLDASRLRTVGREEVYDLPQGPLRLLRLDAVMPGGAPPEDQDPPRYAVVAGAPGRAVGILIDGFVGHQEVVVKPIGRRLRDLPGLAGATDLGDATAVLVLDPEALAAGEDDGRAGV
ncbi:MAG: hypothetical protein DMF50_03310 [Acidobacteria bacterium]|nr:MAG: hypothetical protein DMF50_03310 [Acidobacteriota bacterium]